MGLTPLEGLIMGTRCGDLDPAAVLHLMREKGLSIEEIDDVLNRRSGLRGLSGTSSDLRELEESATGGDPRAILTIQVFCYRIRKYIGAYVAALGGLDTLVFTGGIGEGSAWVRGVACQGLSYMGIEVDDTLNRSSFPASGEVSEISGDTSRVKVLLIPTDEEKMIARETIRTLGYQMVAQVIERQKEKRIPIEVTARHVHLSKTELEMLFGPEHELTPVSSISQPSLFECTERVNLLGPKGRIEGVRVIGPVRKQTQVEISVGEESRLGMKAPVRASGDLEGTPGITLEGPKGMCTIPQGVICSMRHIHMGPEDALSFGVKDRDEVMVKVGGERALIFGDVLVRVSETSRLSMHIDTDEANAADIEDGIDGQLIGVQDRR
jgi:acetate kinase